MDDATLIRQRQAIDAAAQGVLTLTDTIVPQPAEAARALGTLAVLVRDHLAQEDPVIYDTVLAIQRTRHADAAAMSASEFEALKRDWTGYILRWDEVTITTHWPGFVDETKSMLERLRTRVRSETAILYSLAEHCGVIAAGD